MSYFLSYILKNLTLPVFKTTLLHNILGKKSKAGYNSSHWLGAFYMPGIANFFLKFIFGCISSSLLHVGFSLVEVSGLLIAVASRCGARALGTRASVVVAHRLTCSAACGIFLDQGSNPCALHWQADS